jgi:hypothetical protein
LTCALVAHVACRFGVNEAREAISGDVQLARRCEEFPLTRGSADDEFEDLVPAAKRAWDRT